MRKIEMLAACIQYPIVYVWVFLKGRSRLWRKLSRRVTPCDHQFYYVDVMEREDGRLSCGCCRCGKVITVGKDEEEFTVYGELTYSWEKDKASSK